jgi:hypothetical protein
MDCEAGDFACHVETVRIKIALLLPFIRATAQYITDIFNGAVEALKPHLSALIALSSFSFAVWKWVRYREAALFRRLKELVAQTVGGLRVGRSDLLDIVCRPAPGQVVTAPLFIEDELRQLLLKRHWQLVLGRSDPLTRTDRRLDRVQKKINKQLEWTEMRETVLREQQVTVHLIKGAIASACHAIKALH